MGYIIAGLAIAAVGSGASAYGSSQQADAAEDAAKYAAYLNKKFGDEQLDKLDALTEQKTERLKEVGSILEEYGGGPTAGSQENLDLLRKTQNDFLRMGAGDFEAFDAQLKDVMAATLANTQGSGAPAGAFTQLSAQNINALRQQGIQSGISIGQLLAGESFNLLGSEFSILDQDFNLGYQIGKNQIDAIAGYQQQAAQSAGADWQAGGSFLTNIGSALVSYGTMGLNNATANAPKAQAVPQSVASQYGVQQPLGAYPFMPQTSAAPSLYTPMLSGFNSGVQSPSVSASSAYNPSLPNYANPVDPGGYGVLPPLGAFDNPPDQFNTQMTPVTGGLAFNPSSYMGIFNVTDAYTGLQY